MCCGVVDFCKYLTNMMKNADLPKDGAFEPNEEAHQPLLENTMPPFTNHTTSKKLTFAKNVDLSEKPSSQSSSSYSRGVLSQPAASLSHSQRLLWLQKRRNGGLWAQCDKCDRWRFLPRVVDRYELPMKWYCSMNPDSELASCVAPEAPLRLHDEEDLIHSEYSAGSLVWARLGGWPWWPAMVDDCPDAEQFYWLDGFSDIPTHYNVVFFDKLEVTRAWIAPENLKPYSNNKNGFKYLFKHKKYGSRIRAAVSEANEAETMTIEKRLEVFSFLSRHKGNINSPKKVNKNDLIKYQRRFKNKFNIEFPIEDSDSDTDDTQSEIVAKNKNVIMLGTPKRAKRAKSPISKVQKLTNSEVMKEMYQPQTEVNSKEDASAKPSNSMAVQIGSTESNSNNNDTSITSSTTTYLPDNESEKHDYARIETPNSDDFDF